MDAVSNVTGQIHRSDNYEHITHIPQPHHGPRALGRPRAKWKKKLAAFLNPSTTGNFSYLLIAVLVSRPSLKSGQAAWFICRRCNRNLHEAADFRI